MVWKALEQAQVRMKDLQEVCAIVSGHGRSSHVVMERFVVCFAVLLIRTFRSAGGQSMFDSLLPL